METQKLPIWHPHTLIGEKLIGSGSYGSVYLASIPNTNNKIAIKRNLLSKETSFLGSIRELDILVRLKNHPFIVNLESITLNTPIKPSMNIIFKDDDRFRVDKLYFIFENGAYDGRTLIYGGQTSYTYLKLAMCQLLLGVEFIHSKGIIHRDLKPDNLLWFRNGVDRAIKICDFGMSKFFCGMPKNNIRAMTSWYRAPEIIFGNGNYDAKIDVWAVGCIMFEMISKCALLHNIDKRDNNIVLSHKLLSIIPELPTKKLIEKISGDTPINFNYALFSKKRPTYDKLIGLSKDEINMFNQNKYGKYNDFIDLLHKTLVLDPQKRMTASNSLDHKFFDGFRSYINQVRSKFPIYPSTNDLVDPRLNQYKIINTIERVWAIQLFKSIINNKTKFKNYKDRMIFLSLDMFDRYLVYLYNNNIYNKNIPYHGSYDSYGGLTVGPFNSKFDTELRAVSCFYMAIKYYITMENVHSYDTFVGPEFKTPDAIQIVENFELSMITVIMNYQIYRPTLYETMDLYRLKLTQTQVIDLFDYYSSDYFVNSTNILTNSDPMNLYDVIKKFIDDHPDLSNKLVNRINPIVLPKQFSNFNISSPINVTNKSNYVPVMPSKPMSLRNFDSTLSNIGNIGMNTIAGLPTMFEATYKPVRPMAHPTNVIQNIFKTHNKLIPSTLNHHP